MARSTTSSSRNGGNAGNTMGNGGNGDDDGMNLGSGRFRAQFWKTEMCRFWRNGCRNGKLCPFAHGEEELCGRPDLCKTSLCQRWAKGACPLQANECRFAHGRLDLRATPNFMHTQGEDGIEPSFDEYGEQIETQVPPYGNGPTNSQGPQGAERHQAPQMWEEECFGDGAHGYMSGGAGQDMMSWGTRGHGVQGNGNEGQLDQMQAAFAQREWQWSAEGGDGLQDGDAHQARNGARRRARAAKTPLSGAVGPGTGAPMPLAAPAGPSNGRPQQLPQTLDLQQLFNSNPSGPAPLPESSMQQQWPQPLHDGGDGCWNDGMQANGTLAPAEATYAGGLEHSIFKPVSQVSVSEFPHAITAPDDFRNIMNPAVPQELRAIWG